ncbi:MAG: electron transfer flavoprotein subunit alpha/FixB family protein [Desulfobacteraceae bacterium]|nr:electron transfer flavoprotein subunit alpha/FixB family protein [Desulfobacteraceae bacterium]
MMPKEIWSFIESEDGKLHDTAPKMVSEAKRDSRLFDGVSCAVFFGPPSSISLLKELEAYGLEKIYFIKSEDNLTPEILAENIYSLASERHPELILFPHTPTGGELGSRLGAKLKKGVISNCVDFELKGGKLTARKPIYEGKSYGYYTWRNEPPYIATINLTSLEAAEADKRIEPEIVHEKYKGLRTKASLVKRWKMPLSELEITEARLVIGVGNGLDRKEFMGVIEKLAELLEGVIGGTRVAVFQGLIPVERQIGSTGKFINADIYMPIGISGSNRHTSGIRNVKHVVPINTHKEAPIFKFAELGVVNDLYEVVPHLIEIIRKELEAKGD